MHRPTWNTNDSNIKTLITHSKVRHERRHFHHADEKLPTMTAHHVAEGQGKQELSYSQLNWWIFSESDVEYQIRDEQGSQWDVWRICACVKHEELSGWTYVCSPTASYKMKERPNCQQGASYNIQQNTVALHSTSLRKKRSVVAFMSSRPVMLSFRLCTHMHTQTH